MPDNDMLRRYLDAGIAFTQMTRDRAEAIVRDFVKTGELQRDQAQKNVDDLLDQSRKNTERLLDMVRKEIQDQLQSFGLATRADVERIESRLSALESKRSATPSDPAPGPTVTPGGSTRGLAKKAATTKTTAKKAVAKKAPAKKASGTTKKA